MNKFKYALMTALLIGAVPLMAQDKPQEKPAEKPAQKERVNSSGGNSPHETTGAVVDGNRVTITYGRPYMKGRTVWGGKLVPAGTIWRTGSDEATTMITEKPIEMGGKTIPAGAYTLWTMLAEDGSAKLMVNKQIGQWGINPRNPKSVYDPANNIAEVDLEKTSLDTPVEEFTINVTRDGHIKLSWDKTQYSASFKVQK
jgi:hypothetical protein